VQGNFEQAIKIYRDISDSTDTDEKYKARAGYHIGVCLFETGHTEQAVEQFEFVLNNYPLQRDAALKSVKMIQDIQSGTAARRIQKKEQKPKPFVVNAVPGLYSEDIDPNVKAITIIFSEPMKKTDWFYSSFAPALMPSSAGQPSFDQAGLEWTVPVKLGHGKVYAIAVNCGDAEKDIKNFQAGFRSILGQKCENFVLVFATASAEGETSPNGGDEQRMPTLINEKIIEECEKINFGP
jgi:tetratricopeptide (TPR) repeat protein